MLQRISTFCGSKSENSCLRKVFVIFNRYNLILQGFILTGTIITSREFPRTMTSPFVLRTHLTATHVLRAE